MSKVSQEVAEREVNEWLDFKRIKTSRRKDLEDQIEGLVNLVMEGDMVILEDKTIELALGQPLDSKSKLTFKPRLSLREVQPRLREVKPGDADGRLMAYICALTGESMGVLGLMDTVDYTACTNIAVFFL